jgi:RNA polymerase sigma-70 factor (ECF subfamily)
MHSLATSFLGVLGTSCDPEGEAELETALGRTIARAEAAWPAFRVPPVDFVEALASAVGPGGDLAAKLEGLHAADLYLARACAASDPAALKALDASFLSAVNRYVSSVDPSAAFADEVRQNLRHELLVTEAGRPPRIADYSGRGPLAGWLRVVAVRRALNLRRGRAGGPQASEDDAIEIASGAPDPELDYLKALYRQEFREAFVAALAELGPEERNALRLHHLDGLTLDESAVVCRVSRATVARWLANARQQVLRRTQRLLRERLRIDDSTLESVLGLVQSQLDLSIGRYLGDREG